MVSKVKIDIVSRLISALAKAKMLIIVHYHGITVSEIDVMRKKFRENGVIFQVVKNNLMKIAIQDGLFEKGMNLLSGPSAVIFSEDPVAAAKSVIDLAKENQKLKVIGGVFEEELIKKDKIEILSSLPSLDELRAQLLRVISAPATQIARVITEPYASLVRVNKAKADKSN